MPAPKTPDIAARFRRQRRRDTEPELALRRQLHARGLRYRVDQSPLTGMRSRADLVFRTERVAVFVDGCFWHGCPIHGTLPQNNRSWWRKKLEANRQRDERVNSELEREGWSVARVWEHEDPAVAADRVEALVRGRRQ